MGIAYKKIKDKKYKYELLKPYTCHTTFRPANLIQNDYLLLSRDGLLVISQGYQWDGPSGISIDTKNFMRGSLVHDALYQLIDEGFLTPKRDRKKADQTLRRICREDGMSWFRAWYVYRAVRMFGGLYVARKNKSA